MPSRALPPVENLVRGMLALRFKGGRELAILGASWLDAALEINLREHFHEDYRTADVNLFKGGLKSMAAKTYLAEALGSIPCSTVRIWVIWQDRLPADHLGWS